MNDTPIKEISKKAVADFCVQKQPAFCSENPPKSQNSAPLGIITKLQVSPANKGIERSDKKNDYNAVLAREERYALQDVACEILPHKSKVFDIKNNKFKTVNHRVKTCLKRRITKDKGVTVFYNEEREKAQYGNLQLCCSVWDCPNCAMRITEGRRLELQQGIKNWRSKGGYVYLVTFTNRHHVGDNLNELLHGQSRALINFWQKTKVKKMLKLLGYEGRITATEVTYGSNGWHPHYHMLFFFSSAINQQALQSFLAIEWQKSCVRVGLKKPTIRRGVDVQDGSYADKYVSKWGLESEMTKGHVKKGRDEGLTPFDLLRKAKAEPDNEKWGKLFLEYSNCFHGKQQLVWSRGLKDLLQVDLKTDEELANETDNASSLVKEIPLPLWDLVLKYKKRSEYLHAIELDYLDGTERADNLLMELAKNYISKVLVYDDTG